MVIFRFVEIESQGRGPKFVSCRKKGSRREISEEGGEGGEKKVLSGVLE